MARSEIIEIDNLFNIGLHITNELELHIGLKESARDLVKAIVQHLLVDDGRIAHLLKSAGNTSTQLCEHHLPDLMDPFTVELSD